jgi:hypothetical protein
VQAAKSAVRKADIDLSFTRITSGACHRPVSTDSKLRNSIIFQPPPAGISTSSSTRQ